MEISLEEVAKIVDGTIEGDKSAVITGVAEIQNAKSGELSFLGNPKYTKYLKTTNAEAILVPKNFRGSYKNLIRVDQPNLAFAIMISKFLPSAPLPTPKIDRTAQISDNVKLGNNVFIGPNVVIEENSVIEDEVIIFSNSYIGYDSKIGAKTILYSNVSLYHKSIIGRNVIIHSGVVIGSDGFGFVKTGDDIVKIPQAGRVVINDEVEIGANTTIDRGTLGDTVIGRGTKIDNLVQIAHNVKIGEYCFVAAQCGIAGSVTIQDFVTLAGQVGVAGHLTIGVGAIVAAQSGVTKDVPPGTIVFGYPAQERNKARRDIANIRSITDIKRRLKKIEDLTKDLKQE
jgi:UDP-3-O-[3-hydroxymyristoyl] glucosamine N-acyltransferase